MHGRCSILGVRGRMTGNDEVEVLAGHGAEQRAHEVQEAHVHRLVEHRALK